MKKHNKFNTEFDPKLLDQLAQDEGSCVHVHTLEHHIALHPFQLNDLNASVKDILNREIAKYSTKLDGILFGYKNIKFLSKMWQLCEDSCFVHVDIEADFFIFKPTVGKTLQGVVHKKSEDHVGCLVHKIFNVTLPRPKKHADSWLGHSLALSSEILFTVTHTNFDGRLPYIKGEIVSVLSNPLEESSKVDLPFENKHNENGRVKKSKHAKKLRFENEESELIETGPSNISSENDSKVDLSFGNGENEDEHVKKSKRSKKLYLENDESEVTETQFSDKKSKKRKRSLSEADVVEEMPKKKRKKSKRSEERMTP